MDDERPVSEIRLLGGVIVGDAAGLPLRFNTRKSLALLAILACQRGKPIVRDRLIGLLWGDKDEDSARANLRQSLAALRKDLVSLPDLKITTPNGGLCLEVPKGTIDIERFEVLADSAQEADQTAALALYKGPLLDGFVLDESGFEDWLREERTRLHNRAVSLADHRLGTACENGDPVNIENAAQDLLRLEPHREDVHRTLIRSFALQGQRAQALAQYQACREALARDLDLEPDEETERLVDAIRAGGLRAGTDPAAEDVLGSPGAAATERSFDSPTTSPTASTNLSSGRVQQARSSRNRFAAVVLALVVLVGGLTLWRPWATDIDPLRSDHLALPLPDKPSIAVMAFDNMSGDPAQDYLSDAMSESIITELSRFPELFVIARNSSFTYKDKPVKVQQVAEELGVRYILEGSVQRAGNQLRISAQLIDALKGHHLWAERYDRDTTELFVIQDEITSTIVATVQGKVLYSEREKSGTKPPANLTALEYVWKGDKVWAQWDHASMGKARDLYEKALEIDPNLVRGYIGLVGVYIAGHRNGWTLDGMSRDESVEQAFKAARKAVALAPYDYYAHFRLGATYSEAGDQDRALVEYRRALELNPNAAEVLNKVASAYFYKEQFEQSDEAAQRAMRLNPHHPDWWNWNRSWGHYYRGDYQAAHDAILSQNPFPNLARRMLAAIYVRLGRMEDARETVNELLKNDPDYTVEKFRLSQKDRFTNQALLEKLLNDVRQAGLPE